MESTACIRAQRFRICEGARGWGGCLGLSAVSESLACGLWANGAVPTSGCNFCRIVLFWDLEHGVAESCMAWIIFYG